MRILRIIFIFILVGSIASCSANDSTYQVKSCDIKIEEIIQNEFHILKINATSCDADVDMFIGLLEKQLILKSNKYNIRKIHDVSVMGPIGLDNLSDINNSWKHACKNSNNKASKVNSNDFIKTYKSKKLIFKLKELFIKYGIKLDDVSVDNFYPLLKKVKSKNSCDAYLLTPTLWLSKKRPE